MPISPAVTIALARIDAWSRHDWDKTRALLAPDVHAWVTNTQPSFARTVEFTGVDEYMVRKVRGAQLVEPGSVQVIATFGDESNALILATFRIGLGPGGTMVTMARACLYSLDENKKIKEERDEFLVLTIDTTNMEEIMAAKVIFGNHSSVIVPRQDRDSIRRFYCDVLGGKITKGEEDRDFLCLGDNFYMAFLYGDVPDERGFLRTARSIWLEIKSDNVKGMRREILESGLVKKLEMPDPHLYFQAPGGQCFRLVGIDEDLSFYEGAELGPDVAKVKEAVKGL